MVRQKRSMKINRQKKNRVDLCVRTPVDELKGKMWMLCRKGTNKLNRYSDEQVHLWTCRAVEMLTGKS